MTDFDNLTGKKILFAEDDLLNKMIIKRILDKLPLNYEIADNGKAAVDLFREQQFDMIFMDIQMPVMDGFTATRNIRSLLKDNSGSIPIIALTASIDDDLQLKVKAVGMNEYLLKPFSPEALYEKILEYLK